MIHKQFELNGIIYTRNWTSGLTTVSIRNPKSDIIINLTYEAMWEPTLLIKYKHITYTEDRSGICSLVNRKDGKNSYSIAKPIPNAIVLVYMEPKDPDPFGVSLVIKRQIESVKPEIGIFDFLLDDEAMFNRSLNYDINMYSNAKNDAHILIDELKSSLNLSTDKIMSMFPNKYL